MTSPAGIIRAAGAEPCRPWPRHILSFGDWAAMAAALATDELRLLALWADTVQIHALFLDDSDKSVLAASVDVVSGGFPALSPFRPGAAWFERMVRDLWGHTATGGTDARPWLDHGLWAHAAPLAQRPLPSPPLREPPQFRIEPGSTRMQWPLGPIQGGIEESAHVRLVLQGDRVLRAEARLGYTHKGTLALMRGKSPRMAARFAARLAGDSTVAHAIAFAQATEAALQTDIPPRATALRAIMAEVERIAGHLDQLGALARAAEARDVQARCGYQREGLLRAAEAAFGHRLMMDCVVPGGVAADIAPGGAEALLRAMGGVANELPHLRRLLQGTALAARLTGTGTAKLSDIQTYAVGGVAGRASGRGFDARQFAPVYASLHHFAATDRGGDAAARSQVRSDEIRDSLHLIGSLLDPMPEGPISAALPMHSGEGIGCAESIHGDVWHWLRLDHGQIAAVFPRDSGWSLWPLAETLLTGAALEDVTLIRCSLGLPVSGMDL